MKKIYLMIGFNNVAIHPDGSLTPPSGPASGTYFTNREVAEQAADTYARKNGAGYRAVVFESVVSFRIKPVLVEVERVEG